MSNNSEKANQLYLQAKKAFRVNKGVDFFNNEFSIPTELLLIEMGRIAEVGREHKHRQAFRQIFDTRLMGLLEVNADFDQNYLGKDILASILKQERKKQWVYFGVPIKHNSSTPLPFGKTIKLDGITFYSIEQKQFEKAHNKKCLDDFYEKFDENLKHRESRSWLLKDFYFFKARVETDDPMAGANVAIDAFKLLNICGTVAQNRSSYRHTMSSTATKLKSRSILASMGLVLVSSEKHADCEIFWSSDIRTKSDERLEFTTNQERVKSFSMYLRICNEDTPISKRLRQFLFEFANALHSEDPHIRQLGLWRCLEIATSARGTNRSEEEVIKIIRNFYPKSQSWQQQGSLIKDARNKYVHNGTTLERDVWGSVDKYINWTQEYVDKALSIMRWMRDNDIGKKSSDEIDAFFDLYLMPPSTLALASKMDKGRVKS